MFKPSRLLRFEQLEDRTLLAVTVGFENDTIVVRDEIGEDNDVLIKQVGDYYLGIKDHGEKVKLIDLREHKGPWNLDVYLDGGDDRLDIEGLQYKLKRLRIHTGGELGEQTTDTDNDMVRIRHVKAYGIAIDTGATIGEKHVHHEPSVAFVNGSYEDYEDTDRVEIHHTFVHGDVIIRTGAKAHIPVQLHDTKAVTDVASIGLMTNQLNDNDMVYVGEARIAAGRLDIDTGTHVHATVWHNQNCLDDCEPANSLEAQSLSEVDEVLATLYDNDRVKVKDTTVYGNVKISTGTEAAVSSGGTEFTALAFEEYGEQPYQLGVYLDDQDIVEIMGIEVRHIGEYYHGMAKWGMHNHKASGNLWVRTGASLENTDPYVYLAVGVNDNDDVALKYVQVHHSIHIKTGLNLGQPTVGVPDGNHVSDVDRVMMKKVRQVGGHGTTKFELGKDDDYLYLDYVGFRGPSMFDGGDHHDTKKVSSTYHPYFYPIFVNFEAIHGEGSVG